MAEKTTEKKPNFFVRFGQKTKKFFSDLAGELKKVTWTSKTEVIKSTKLVLVMVICISIAIGLIDFGFTKLLQLLAGLIG